MIIHAATMANFTGGYDERQRDTGGKRCRDCPAEIGYRATRCKLHANQHSAEKRTAQRKVNAMMRRFLTWYHAQQAAEAEIDAAIDAALGGFEREVERAERSVRG